MERLVVTARLRRGAAERARELVAAGPPFDPDEIGFSRHGVYLSGGEVVFVFEGGGVEWLVEGILNDPVRSASLSAWAPLLEGRPRLAREAWYWERQSSRSPRASA